VCQVTTLFTAGGTPRYPPGSAGVPPAVRRRVGAHGRAPLRCAVMPRRFLVGATRRVAPTVLPKMKCTQVLAPRDRYQEEVVQRHPGLVARRPGRAAERSPPERAGGAGRDGEAPDRIRICWVASSRSVVRSGHAMRWGGWANCTGLL